MNVVGLGIATGLAGALLLVGLNVALILAGLPTPVPGLISGVIVGGLWVAVMAFVVCREEEGKS